MALRGPQIVLFASLTLFAAPGTSFAQDKPPEAQTTAAPADAAPVVVLDELQTTIRDLLDEGAKKGGFLNRRDAAAVKEFYAERNFAAAWVPDGVLTDRARSLIERIVAADTDGLDPAVFAPPSLTFGKYGKAQTPFTAKADILLSQAIAAYAREAYAGGLDPADISSNFGYERHEPDLVAALRDIDAAKDPVATLAGFNPQHPEFVALRDKLAALRAAKDAELPFQIPEGATLKLGVADARVGFLRKRLELPTDVESPEIFDETVAEAVKTFQKSARLKADGIVGPKTVAALNAGPVDLVPIILVNMEKWRWMPRDLGRFHVRVSVPDFTVAVMRDGAVTHTTRIVVGKTDQQTPIFSDQIEHIVVNPAWNVPASIAQNELLPALRSNPGALRGYQVFALIRGKYRAVDPRSLNWRRIDARKIQIRQPPGERNALGKIKFMFPNNYAVYLHDTPAKSLFQRDYRAFSHGCMRVMEPMEFADALLAEEPDLNAAYLKKLYGGSEKTVKLTKHVPVHITYFTAWVDETGEVQLRDDVYGHDRRIGDAFGSS